MLRSRWMRLGLLAVLVVVAVIAVRLHFAGGQVTDDRRGNAASGRYLVEAWCTECHSVEAATAKTGTIAPDFTAIALRVFLGSPSKLMPHFIIGRSDTDDIIAYILSLRGK